MVFFCCSASSNLLASLLLTCYSKFLPPSGLVTLPTSHQGAIPCFIPHTFIHELYVHSLSIELPRLLPSPFKTASRILFPTPSFLPLLSNVKVNNTFCSSSFSSYSSPLHGFFFFSITHYLQPLSLNFVHFYYPAPCYNVQQEDFPRPVPMHCSVNSMVLFSTSRTVPRLQILYNSWLVH